MSEVKGRSLCLVARLGIASLLAMGVIHVEKAPLLDRGFATDLLCSLFVARLFLAGLVPHDALV